MKILLLPLLTLFFTGCGAFADAANGDGGTPDAGPTLKVNPETIKPRQLNEFELTFTLGPPWKKADCNYTYPSELDTGGADLEYRNVNYQGENWVALTLEAHNDIRLGERHLRVEVTCDKLGQPQQTHSEWGRLYVLRDQTDGGSR